MGKSLADPFRGSISFLFLILNTIFWVGLLLVVALVKLLIPVESWRTTCSRVSNAIAQSWVGLNSLGLHLTRNIHWDIQGTEGLEPKSWYLLVANHQSMVDIAVLQKIFHRKAPVLKFFLKRELIWVPFLGAAWWALDFPFMRRMSSTHDLATTRRVCDKFKILPVTVMNFVEGTRFTGAKREEQKSPFKNLLKPKAGGIAVVLGCMGDQLRSILDVTIVYPEGVPGLWKFLSSGSLEIKVRVRQLPIPAELMGDYFKDRQFRQRFNGWLNTLWNEKDHLIETLKG